MKPIYEPKGKAKEYGDFALNIYTGCPHRCYYCYSPSVLRKDKEVFHTCVEVRKNLVSELKKQLESEKITDKLIHLCFSCDPFPKGYNQAATFEVIRLLKAYGNHVQILTKNGTDAIKAFDLLDNRDWFGVTHTGYNENPTMPSPLEPRAGATCDRIKALVIAKSKGIRTWVSCEPTIDPLGVLRLIETGEYIDKFMIGKLNYYQSTVNWANFGRIAEEKCRDYKRDYYIKDSLRAEMVK